ncbi:MAG: hypothetical protein P0Y55_00625 [Candidatus Cohnella colombiensis]|uniref:DUF4352 domain-containing protein n=1 Tax=Candidatus Cohnella colombiensis TaxID=3121368 RepID=A0AA95EX75_9BACL|nr:MAG: hypothetical protein P0Y55_00625 [Cohnella sp.]
MKKLLTILCVLGVAALTACGTNSSKTNVESEPATPSSKQSSDQSDEQKVFEQNFGEPFYFESKTMNGTYKVMITLTDHEIVNERHAEDRLKDDTDYIKVFLRVENVGDGNSSSNVIDFGSFKAYNSNGVDITKEIGFSSFDIRYVDGEFKQADLRPNGKNEGYLYIPIEEEAIPTELIFYESTLEMFIAHSKQYVYKL